MIKKILITTFSVLVCAATIQTQEIYPEPYSNVDILQKRIIKNEEEFKKHKDRVDFNIRALWLAIDNLKEANATKSTSTGVILANSSNLPIDTDISYIVVKSEIESVIEALELALKHLTPQIVSENAIVKSNSQILQEAADKEKQKEQDIQKITRVLDSLKNSK